MSSARQELLDLLAVKSFRLGEFKLSSGARSDYYIDCRTTTLDAKGARLTGQVFLEEIHLRQDATLIYHAAENCQGTSDQTDRSRPDSIFAAWRAHSFQQPWQTD